MRTLVNNMDKNRKKWRADMFDTDVSAVRKVALDTVKDKIDQQQSLL
jgi:hypothetical protein